MKPILVITIENAYSYTKRSIETAIRRGDLSKRSPELMVYHRSMFSMKMEWATHKILYRLGVQRGRTKDLDLDWPQPWYMTAAYIIVGILSWLFIR